MPLRINQNGDIAGLYIGLSAGPHGFVRLANGLLPEFDGPTFLDTIPQSINRAGQIVGYGGVSRGVDGFLRNPNGKLVRIHIPGFFATIPYAINDAGVMSKRSSSIRREISTAQLILAEAMPTAREQTRVASPSNSLRERAVIGRSIFSTDSMAEPVVQDSPQAP